MTSTSIRTDIISDSCVRLACTLAASPERVYRAWTEADAICQWFLPGPGSTCRTVKLDATVGGDFELLITTPVGESSTMGTFETLEPARLIEFSFGCRHDSPEHRSSHVSVELTPEGEGTRLVLTDRRIATPEDAKSHLLGWQGCLGGLVEFISSR